MLVTGRCGLGVVMDTIVFTSRRSFGGWSHYPRNGCDFCLTTPKNGIIVSNVHGCLGDKSGLSS